MFVEFKAQKAKEFLQGDFDEENNLHPLTIARKMDEIETRWQEIAGIPLCRVTAPVAYEEKEDAFHIKVNISEPMAKMAAMSRRARLELSLTKILDRKVRIDFALGSIVKNYRHETKEPIKKVKLKDLSEETLKEGTEAYKRQGASDELAHAMARISEYL
ncbi:MAG: hypothetical protein Q4C78_05165 [Synergistaceae bacterium]|nr:hypothetical protein [Synergistaceae bacterium]